MSARLRPALNVLAGAIVLGVLALGGAWLADRRHRWDEPAWQPRDFVWLPGAGGADVARGAPRRGGSDSQGRWVMPVNPRCEHCVATLHRLDETWSRHAWKPDLIALIVDTPRRPGRQALAPIPAAQVWWDARGIWRARWGHRLYGELIQFDGAGRFVRTLWAEDIIRRGRLPLPETRTPATPDRGGG